MSDSGNINQRWSIEGSEEFIAALRKMAAEAEKTQASLAGSTDKATVSMAGLEAAVIGLQNGFRELSLIAGSAAGPITRIVGSLGALTSGFTAVGAAVVGVTAGLAALAKQGADAADEVRDGAIRVGTSAEQYSTLKFALQQSGAGAEGFEKAMFRVFDAATKSQEAGEKAGDGAKKIEGANDRIAQSSEKVNELFRQRNQDLADEARKSAEQIADLTRQKGSAEEELRLASNRRVEDIERNATRQLNDILRKRNQEAAAALNAFNKQVEAAAQQAADGGDEFAKLGVKLRSANGDIRDSAEIFKDIAEQVSKIENPATRSAKAIELFSRRAGPKMVEALSLGRAGIEALQKEANDLGIGFTKLQTEVGDNFNDAIAKLSGTIAATSQKIGLLFAPAFTAIAETLAKTFGGFQEPILKALKPIADDLTNLFTGNIAQVQSVFLIAVRDIVVEVLVPAFRLLGVVVTSVLSTLGKGFHGLADGINAVFGTKFTAVDIPLFIVALKAGAAAVGVLTAAFTALRVAALANPVVAIITGIAIAAALVIANWEPIKKFFIGLFIDLGTALNTAGQAVQNFFDATSKFFTDLDTAIRETLTGLGTWISDNFWATVRAIGDAITWVADWIKTTLIDPVLNWFQWIIDKAKQVGTAIASALSGLFGTGPAGQTNAPPPIPGNRAGGMVRGPGTGTSDSILSWISNGEFIVNAAATRAFRPLLEAINRGLVPRGAQGAPGFAAGGFFDPRLGAILQRSLLSGGRSTALGRRGTIAQAAAGSGRPFQLVIDGRTFGGMTASDDAVNDFIQFARGARMRSLGRKPSYYGNG